MHLRVALPFSIVVDQDVGKVCAEGSAGSFCLLPNHVDFASGIEPGLLWFEDTDGQEVFLAVAAGLLVKVGPNVRVATSKAVQSRRLGDVQSALEESILQTDHREEQTQQALEKMRADFVRRFVELGHE